MKRDGYLDRVAALFRSRPGEWLTCYQLQDVGGFGGWRTRVSQCRTDLHMDVSPARHRKKPNGVRYTEYKFTPKAAPSQPPLFDQQPAA